MESREDTTPREYSFCPSGYRSKITPIFLSHPVGVKTNLPLKQTLEKSHTLSRLVKWVTLLSEYDISYLPRMAIKAQVLVDFISEMASTSPSKSPNKEVWLLHVDGPTTSQGSAAKIVITSPQVDDMEFAIGFDFKASNNNYEYEV
ncbi:UNVERIFIED_CONTAM: hypothetical protein Slati_0801700 [Sesamum latifolium]|uniref:Uncharacterized protein n=1 Tax=Sesamum latifolium TaxID=2727402 RepID=A0AAW2XLN7_9LAMI